MTMVFNSCKGKSFCQENETGCRTCGRSMDEIYTTRRIIDEFATFAADMDYSNMDEFINYVATKVANKIHYLNEQKRLAVANGYH
jgi:hypothetical protein